MKNIPHKCIPKPASILLLLLLSLVSKIQATLIISDTFTRTGDFLSSTADTSQTWSAASWNTDGSGLNVTASSATRIGGLTFDPNTLYILTMDVSVATGGSDWIGFGFSSAAGNPASNSRGFMLHRNTTQVQFFSSGTGGAQSAPSPAPFPNTMEIHLSTGSSLVNSSLTYKLNGVVLGSCIATDASTISSVFVQNIGGATGVVDNFSLNSAPLPPADTFPGFSMDFVNICQPGNAADDNGYGAVGYEYRMATYEVSERMIDAYNSANPSLLISKDTRGLDRSATNISWNEAARFVNWLNTSSGFPVAYKFTGSAITDDIELWATSDPGYDADNLFRNSNAHYFLPSMDEWYKAASYDSASATYYNYATGSDSTPTSVSGGTAVNTAVYLQSTVADHNDAGGLSPYGTMAQSGNVWDIIESGFAAPNNAPTQTRIISGGYYASIVTSIETSLRAGFTTNQTFDSVGFRLASRPALVEPEITVEEPLGVDLTSGSATLDFGAVLVGASSPAKTITICNEGLGLLTGLSVGVVGTNAADFSVDSSLLGTQLSSFACRTITVTFNPSAAGNRTATLLITSNDSDENPFTINLSGVGTSNLEFVHGAYLKASNTGIGDYFGHAVAVSGDTIAVGAYSENSAGSGINQDLNNENANASGTVYVYIKDAFCGWRLESTLKASNAEDGDNFGFTLDISGDTIVVGARGEDSASTGVNGIETDNSALSSGAAYVFHRNGGNWSQQAYLKASNTGSGDRFGDSVSISGDTVIVGAFNEESPGVGVNGVQGDGATNAGAAYVYTRTGNSWSQEAYLKSPISDGSGWFGSSVAVSGDRVVVGSYVERGLGTGVNQPYQTDGTPKSYGAAYIFDRVGGVWSQQAYLKASNTGLSDGFGIAVAVDGDLVVVGAAFERSAGTGTTADQSDDSAFSAGAAYLFERGNGGTWSQVAYLKPSNTDAEDRFGQTVAVSERRVLIGSRNEGSSSVGIDSGNEGDNSLTNAGAAYLFEELGGAWSQKSYIKATNTDGGDRFGFAVDIDSATVAIGADSEGSRAILVNGNQTDNSKNASGAVYVLEAPENTAGALNSYNLAAAAAGLSGPAALPDAIPFNDGVSNLLKYAFNMDLSGPDSQTLSFGGTTGLPAAGIVVINGQNYWQLEFLIRKDSGLTYTPQKSTTLLPSTFLSYPCSSTTTDIDNQWARVIVLDAYDPSSQPGCFYRVLVELSP